MSYPIAGQVKSYQCADYITDHPIIVCKLQYFSCFIALFTVIY